MGLCDICAAEGEGTYVSSSQIREAVANDFNPFKLRLVPWESLEREFESWKGIVEQDFSDWNLCDNCYRGIRPYFSGEPAPKGIKRSELSFGLSLASDPVPEYSPKISNSTRTESLFADLPKNRPVTLSQSALRAIELLILVEISDLPIGSPINITDLITKCAKATNKDLSESDLEILKVALRGWLEKFGSKGHVTRRSESDRDSLEKAAVAGDAAAMLKLGAMYAIGQNVPQDQEEARRWLEKAAAAGLADAMYHLGGLYSYGDYGWARDNAKARHWLEKAAAAGHKTARMVLRSLDESSAASKKCFIASAAYGSADEPDVGTFRRFRDDLLLRFGMGRKLVLAYERLSPSIAAQIADRPILRWLVRFFVIRPLTRLLELIW